MPIRQSSHVSLVSGVVAVLLLAPTVSSALAQDVAPTVDIQGLTFVPGDVHVSPGDTATRANSSPLTHTVSAEDREFDSRNMDAGATFAWTFDTPGIYVYHSVYEAAAMALSCLQNAHRWSWRLPTRRMRRN